jgi:hypothetical protein
MANDFEEWAILELMGHRKLAGKITEATIGGSAFVRIDIPNGATQFYSAGAIYCITPVDEVLAVAAAGTFAPIPISRWELPETTISDDEEF